MHRLARQRIGNGELAVQATQMNIHQQAFFAGGAMTASLVWFVVLALGCQRLTGLFRSAKVWRLLDAGVVILMVYLAGMLIADFHLLQRL